MKKFLSLIALVGIMASCNNKKEKKDEVKTDTTVTTDGKMDDGKMDNGTTANTGVPTFSDPEVQKFANDYAAFIAAYKAGMNDPAKMAELSKNMQEWATKSQSIGMKLANSPDEAKKWADWVMELNKELMPGNK